MPITIKIRENGPYRIEGDDVAQVTLVDHAGNVVVPKGKAISLCRCGGSTTKPFCDGTHSRIGFRGAEEARQAFDARQSAPAAQPTSQPGAHSPQQAAAATSVPGPSTGAPDGAQGGQPGGGSNVQP